MENSFIVPLQRRSEMKRIWVTSGALSASTSLMSCSVSLVWAFQVLFASLLIAYSTQNSNQNSKNIWKGAHTRSWHVRSNIDLPANNTGRFIMFSVITNIYNKKTKWPTLMDLFTATGKLEKFFFWISYQCVPCHPWCTHRTSLVIKKTKNFFSFPVAVNSSIKLGPLVFLL